MTIYSTDFTEYTLDTDLSDWTLNWNTNATYEAVTNSDPLKVSAVKLDLTSTVASARKVLTWDDIGSVADTDILVKIKVGSTLETNGLRIYARVSGGVSSENAYFVSIKPEILTIDKYVAGASSAIASSDFDLSANNEFWIRFRVNDTSLKARIWAVDTVEPNDWMLQGTDSSLTTGNCGLGFYELNQTLYADFFECVTGGNSATYPPSGWEENNSFGAINASAFPGYMDAGRAMGGQFIDSYRKLKGVGIYCTDHSDDIRLAVYSGGSLSTGPEGATLLKDFGKTSGSVVNDYVTIMTEDDIDIPVDTPIWFVVKGDNAAGFQFRSSDLNGDVCCGNYQIARGRCAVDNPIGKDPDVAYPATFPSGSVAFASYWYDVKIYLDDDETPMQSGDIPPIFMVI